jgi:chromosome segregation ATPase
MNSSVFIKSCRCQSLACKACFYKLKSINNEHDSDNEKINATDNNNNFLQAKLDAYYLKIDTIYNDLCDILENSLKEQTDSIVVLDQSIAFLKDENIQVHDELVELMSELKELKKFTADSEDICSEDLFAEDLKKKTPSESDDK